MSFLRPTTFQSNCLLGVVAGVIAAAAPMSHMIDAPFSTWIALVAIAPLVFILFRGYGSRASASLVVGTVYLIASWGSYGIWRFIICRSAHLAITGIDPFAGPLSVMTICIFFLGLWIWVSGVLVLIKQKESSFVNGFLRQRALWVLGAGMIFTSDYFFELVKGV